MKKIVVFVTALILVSCSESKLSHQEALEILKTEYKSYCSIGMLVNGWINVHGNH